MPDPLKRLFSFVTLAGSSLWGRHGAALVPTHVNSGGPEAGSLFLPFWFIRFAHYLVSFGDLNPFPFLTFVKISLNIKCTCYWAVGLDTLGSGLQDTNGRIHLAYRNCTWEWVIRFPWSSRLHCRSSSQDEENNILDSVISPWFLVCSSPWCSS